MSNMIVSDNRIKTRRYNLVIDGKIVEEMLSPKMANVLANEYRQEGFAVDKIEVFSVTNGIEIVGDETVQTRTDEICRKKMLTPAATDLQLKRDRTKSHEKARLSEAKNNKPSTSVRYIEYGRDRKSSLHSMYLDNVKRNGYRVYNKITDEVWIGMQKEIADKIWNYINNGGKKSDLDIKFLGA